MLKKLYSNDGLCAQFMLLVFMQPFIDIYRVFVGNAIEIVGISLVELVNMGFIGYLAILFLLNQRKIKSFIPAIIYVVVLGVYLVFHCYNILQFDTTIMTGTAINVFVEIYVVIRAYVLPVMLLYMMVYVKTPKERFLKTIVATSAVISTVIVVTNLFKVSFISYASGLEENEMIRQNIIEWFTKEMPENLNLITSKGWFYSGNQIGLILLMLYPLVVYYAIQKKKWTYYIVVVVQMIAMMMVATKTAALGSILVLGIFVVLLLLFSLIEKRWKEFMRELLKIIVVMGIGLFILMASPVIQMMDLQELSYSPTEGADEANQNLEEILGEENEEDDGEDEGVKINVAAVSQFLNKYYYIYGIHEDYIKLLPVEQYPVFWLSVISDETKSHINFRSFKQRLYNMVEAENNNPLDQYLGIGYTSNFPYLEKDIASQNVWFGKIGTIMLMGPYLLCFLYAVCKILFKLKTRFTMYNCALGLCICASTLAAITAGHLFGFFFPIILYISIISQLRHAVED